MDLTKDSKLARICSRDEKLKTAQFPLISYLFFIIRDLVVLFFSFYIPTVFTAYIAANYNVNILSITIAG